MTSAINNHHELRLEYEKALKSRFQLDEGEKRSKRITLISLVCIAVFSIIPAILGYKVLPNLSDNEAISLAIPIFGSFAVAFFFIFLQWITSWKWILKSETLHYALSFIKNTPYPIVGHYCRFGLLYFAGCIIPFFLLLLLKHWNNSFIDMCEEELNMSNTIPYSSSGASFGDNHNASPIQGSERHENIRYCMKCGAKLSFSDQFCPKCGERIKRDY